MFKKISLLFLIFLTGLSVALAQSNRAQVILTGIEMVPRKPTPATGSAKVWVQSDTLYVSGEFSNLQSHYFASNIHYGVKGKTGNPIYKLRPDISEDRTSGYFDPEKNKFRLNDAMLEAFKKGNLYITVASAKNRHGEIRGQINSY